MSESSGEPNRLIHETSPYLQQHAYNPVDWYPWGEAAFTEAQKSQRPIFLSVGYSACHWCHVMERESFEHPQIAALMNDWFVNVKVDREERPDVDQLFMTAVQLVTGQGGWPMSVFLTPAGEPFFGGTYWPPVSRHGMLGFADILQRIHTYWEQHREECLAKGSELTQALQELQQQQHHKSTLTENLLEHAEKKILESADWKHGGMGSAPKFPHPMDLKLLLRTWQRFGNKKSLEFVRLTLDKMGAGGIYDHLGGGFARYSTDERWLVPHFEKMLYDNAQLIPVYLEAYRLCGEERYREIIEETIDYIEREMTSEEGGFYSTLDADSEGEEGRFYVWSPAEIQKLLGEDADLFCAVYDVSTRGNWEGKTILQRILNRDQTAEKFPSGDTESRLKHCRQILLEARAHRIRPGRDEKILLAWNGLMLSAIAQAATVLDNPQMNTMAERCADFLLTRLQRGDGRYWHSYKDGQAKVTGFLDDYACLIDGLREVSLLTGRTDLMQHAIRAAEQMIDQFYDEELGAFFYTPHDHERMITRIRDQYDNAIPSGTNLAIHALLQLGLLLERPDFVEVGRNALDTISGTMLHQPTGMCQALLALDLLLDPPDVLLVCLPSSEQTETLQQLLTTIQRNRLSVIWDRTSQQDWTKLSDRFANQTCRDGQMTAYLCHQHGCETPWIGQENILTGLTQYIKKSRPS